MLLKPECIHCGGYNSVGEGTKEVEREEESGEGRRKKKKKFLAELQFSIMGI